MPAGRPFADFQPATSNPRSRLRVAMVSGEYPPDIGGVADYTGLLVQQLTRLGVEVRVLSRREVGGGRQHPTSKLQATASSAVWGPACWQRIAHLAAECHIVHIQYQAAAYDLGGAITLLPLWLRLARPRLRVATTFHDLRVPFLFPKAGPLRRLTVDAMLRGSHAAIFSDREDLQAVGAGPRRRWIPIGSNVLPQPLSADARAALRQQLGLAPEETLIGYFGFVNASKGLETLVAALERVRAGGCSARLLLLGEQLGASDPTNRGAASALDAQLEARGLGPAVLRTGWLPAAALSAHLQACDLIALPFRDGASLRRGSLIAALVHGLPIVTTARAATALRADSPLALRDGRHALLVPPDDPIALAEALFRLAADESLRRRISQGALQLGARFAWPEIAETTLDVYQQLLGRERRRDGETE